jgi:outer membrane biosynthesis protein TonB
MDYKPKNESERRILEYFNANASEDLKARVEASGKTPAGAVKFMESEVRKRFSRASGMVTITDEEGFGIAMHYFEDGSADDFEPSRKAAKAAATKDEKKDPPPARKAKKTKKAPPADGEAAKVEPSAPKAESPKPEVPKAEAPKTEEKKPEEPKMSASESRDRAAGQTFLF